MTKALTLYDLNSLVADVIDTALTRAYWVEAELSEVRENRGHCYMELIEKDDTGNVLSMLAKQEDVRNAGTELYSHINDTEDRKMTDIVRTPRDRKIRNLFKNVQENFPDYIEVYMGTKWGGFTSNHDGFHPRHYDPRERGWYKLASAGQGLTIQMDAFQSALGYSVVGLTKNIYSDTNEYIGAIGIEFSLNTLTEIGRSIPLRLSRQEA